LLPKERSFGKQKKKKEINEIDLNYEIGYHLSLPYKISATQLQL
jgi:hypothetical protein